MDLQFGPYRLASTERRIYGPRGPVELSARSYDILALLLENPDGVIAKAELLERVWPGLLVEDNTLQVHVSALRKALGAGFVMTVHGRGYKYSGPRPVGNGVALAEAGPQPTVFMSGAKTPPVTGGCLCGDIRYRITEPPMDTVICHCRMCQKFSGSAFSIGSVFATEAVAFSKGAPKYFKSSPFAERGFCANCGSSVTFRPTMPAVTAEWEGWILIECGTLDNPASFPPVWEIGVESQLPWLDMRLGHRRVRCQDSPDIVEAWAAFDLPVP
jgi:hypothetical protein